MPELTSDQARLALCIIDFADAHDWKKKYHFEHPANHHTCRMLLSDVDMQNLFKYLDVCGARIAQLFTWEERRALFTLIIEEWDREIAKMESAS